MGLKVLINCFQAQIKSLKQTFSVNIEKNEEKSLPFGDGIDFRFVFIEIEKHSAFEAY